MGSLGAHGSLSSVHWSVSPIGYLWNRWYPLDKYDINSTKYQDNFIYNENMNFSCFFGTRVPPDAKLPG
jgi:hypothetical protein